MTSDELRRELAATRQAIHQDYTALRGELDIIGNTKRAVVQRPVKWLGGAAFVGYLLAGRRKVKTAKVDRPGKSVSQPEKRLTLFSLLFMAIRLLLPVARPALTAFATRKLEDFTAGRAQGPRVRRGTAPGL